MSYGLDLDINNLQGEIHKQASEIRENVKTIKTVYMYGWSTWNVSNGNQQYSQKNNI